MIFSEVRALAGMGNLEICLGLETVSRHIFSVLVLVLRIMSWFWRWSWSEFLLFLQFQNIRPEVVLHTVHTPFFLVSLLGDERAMSIIFTCGLVLPECRLYSHLLFYQRFNVFDVFNFRWRQLCPPSYNCVRHHTVCIQMIQ